jgi:hypothetical protein
MSPVEKGTKSDAVSEFLKKEKDAMEAIEKKATSLSTNLSKSFSKLELESSPNIDWDALERHMMSTIEIDMEAAKADKEFDFLVERYANGAPETEYWKRLMESNTQRINKQREEGEVLLSEMKRKAKEFISKIEEEEKEKCAEYNRKFEEYYK